MLLRRGESAGPSCLGICGGPSSFMYFIEPTSLSLFKPDIWPCVLGLRAYYFKPNQFIGNIILEIVDPKKQCFFLFSIIIILLFYYYFYLELSKT